MSNLPVVPAAVNLPEQPNVPRYDYTTDETGCCLFIGTLMALGGSAWLFFGELPKVWFLIFPVAIGIITGSVWLAVNSAKANNNKKQLWAAYDQQVKSLQAQTAEQASKTWLPVISWWPNPSKHSLTVVFLNGSERAVLEFPEKNVEKIHADVKAARFPNCSYSGNAGKATLQWGGSLWLYDPVFPLPIVERPSFPPEVMGVVQELMMPDHLPIPVVPQNMSVRDALTRLDALIGNEANEEGMPATIQILEALAERMQNQPSLAGEIRTLIALLNQVRSDQDTVQIMTVLRTLREKIESQASLTSARLELGNMG